MSPYFEDAGRDADSLLWEAGRRHRMAHLMCGVDDWQTTLRGRFIRPAKRAGKTLLRFKPFGRWDEAAISGTPVAAFFALNGLTYAFGTQVLDASAR